MRHGLMQAVPMPVSLIGIRAFTSLAYLASTKRAADDQDRDRGLIAPTEASALSFGPRL